MAFKAVKLMIKKRNFGKWSYCFDAGITFKENPSRCSQYKIVDVIAALADYGIARKLLLMIPL
jgi:hypothetical protein